MFCVDDIKNFIRTWFCDVNDGIEAAKLYHEIVSESEKQLEYKIKEKQEDVKHA